MFLVEQAQRAARSMEGDYQEVVRILEAEIRDLRRQAADRMVRGPRGGWYVWIKIPHGAYLINHKDFFTLFSLLTAIFSKRVLKVVFFCV